MQNVTNSHPATDPNLVKMNAQEYLDIMSGANLTYNNGSANYQASQREERLQAEREHRIYVAPPIGIPGPLWMSPVNPAAQLIDRSRPFIHEIMGDASLNPETIKASRDRATLKAWDTDLDITKPFQMDRGRFLSECHLFGTFEFENLLSTQSIRFSKCKFFAGPTSSASVKIQHCSFSQVVFDGTGTDYGTGELENLYIEALTADLLKVINMKIKNLVIINGGASIRKFDFEGSQIQDFQVVGDFHLEGHKFAKY